MVKRYESHNSYKKACELIEHLANLAKARKKEESNDMIDNLSDQEKSVILATAMGWDVAPSGDIFPPDEDISVFLDDEDTLYAPANMALAWRVLNWWVKQDTAEFVRFDEWWCDGIALDVDPVDAQRLWLDKILELAIKAKIIDLEADQDQLHP